ncbi:MAG TPA: LysM peptidoglycan-binding domain-containing protein, partial [Polyangiaceae bacterium]|nr:LysM peptidoglycan-binding domain-containing protein [Polyangiaceae bacterium]
MTFPRVGTVLSVSLVASIAAAQAPGPQAPAPAAPQAPAPSAPPGSVVVPGPGGSVVVTPGSTTTTIGPTDYVDPNAHLPSSSRPIIGDQQDGFDLKGGHGSGSSVVFGDKGSSGVVADESGGISNARPTIPEIHLVRRGDTLWDLCDRYYSNPWQWPRIWSYNPQVENPHWIYPGDQLRMLGPGGAGALSMYDRLGSGAGAGNGNGNGNGNGSGSGGGGRGLQDQRGRFAPNTVILRDQGFIGDPEADNWGEVAGSTDEQMMLSEGNRVYLLVKEGKTVKPKDELTLFRSVRQPENVRGARKPPGEIVAILGTVRVEKFDPNSRIATARIVESRDVIERGARIGPVRRRFDVVPPLPNTKAVRARVLTSLYPHVYMSQDQVVFLDRGTEDGLKPGNRLLIVRRGDTWRTTLENSTRDRVRMDSPENAEIERTPLPGDQEKFPEESIAELRVLRADRQEAHAVAVLGRDPARPRVELGAGPFEAVVAVAEVTRGQAG